MGPIKNKITDVRSLVNSKFTYHELTTSPSNRALHRYFDYTVHVELYELCSGIRVYILDDLAKNTINKT